MCLTSPMASGVPLYMPICSVWEKLSLPHLCSHLTFAYVFIFPNLILRSGIWSFWNLDDPDYYSGGQFFLVFSDHLQLPFLWTACLYLLPIFLWGCLFVPILCQPKFLLYSRSQFLLTTNSSPTSVYFSHSCLSWCLKIHHSMSLFPQKSEHHERDVTVHLRYHCHPSD